MAPPAYTLTCTVCGASFEAVHGYAQTCSKACRALAFRRRQAARDDLLRRQTEAISSGADAVVLASLAREAQRLLAEKKDPGTSPVTRARTSAPMTE